MPLRFLSLFFIAICFSGCARNDFFQKTALVKPETFAASPNPDSALVTVGRHYKRSKFHNLFWGKHYRETWATPVNLPVLHINKEFGGLQPVSLGGGFQTTSLTLKNPANRLYVLRSLDKDPFKTLPKGLRQTFLVNLMRDQTSAGNPFAPLVLPELSKAAGVYYTSPRIFYVAKNDSSFGSFAERMNGKVMLLEEKFDGKEALIPAFGKATDLVDSEVVLKNRFEENKYQIDQPLFARSRLFDVLIGDWDRHEGQWQWAAINSGSNIIYQPIPKDRDQAFYRFDDGIVPWLASTRFTLKKFQTFKKNYTYLPGLIYNARFIDARALNEVTKDEWLKEANQIKENLTDNVLQKAVKKLPAAVYALEGENTLKNLKARRDKLPEAAAKIYAHLAKEVTVPGTDQKEKFVAQRLPNGDTKIQVFALDSEITEPLYSRTFHQSETKAITLHGLGGNDVFEITGEAKNAIRLNVYGGEGEDKLSDNSKIKAWSKKTKVFDTKRGIEMELTPEIKKRLSHNTAIHAYDREGL